MVESVNEIKATGRRKTATAVVTIKLGTGKILINNKDLDGYFKNHPIQKNEVLSPLVATNIKDKIDVNIDVEGGGINAQAGAIKLAIARALTVYNPEFRGVLKKAGMLKRDPRMVERKKPGKPKARKSFQWTKR
ncbi:MAG: 30S ribosomal protein S9 [Endomicrobia bacterium]|nr:30S ribosomal protein S9 [Endomicrobiia bacterium]